MGQGGHLLLKNKTPYRWRLTHKHAYQMKSWDNSFPDILKETANTLFINFTSGMGTTGGFVFPKTLAKGDESFSTYKGTNQLLFNYLLDKMNGVYGIIPMDFPEYPNDSLIPLIISANHF